VVEMAKTQETMCYDGTTSAVVLGGELLGNSEQLFAKGLHPNVICRGFHQAARWAVEHARELPNGSTDLTDVAKTAMTGKTVEHSMEEASKLCVNAVIDADGDIGKVRVLCQPGGAVGDSSLFPGIIMHKQFMIPVEGTFTHVVLINGGLMPEKMEDLSIQFQSASEAKEFVNEQKKKSMLQKASHILAALPDGGVVFVRDGVAENVARFLADNNVGVVMRIHESDILSLSRLLGAPITHDAWDVDADTARPAKSVREQNMANVDFVVVEMNEEICDVSTLVLRGATRQTLEEYERAFKDALGVVSLAFHDSKVIAGGGSAYISMAHHLRQRATDIGGREQMAVEAFAEALEAIPATIAENAGHDPLDTVLALRNDHQQGRSDFGPDILNGGTCSMSAAGVFEPLTIVTQAVQSAAEVATSVLRIDDIISRRDET